jgi:polyisoprenoid-binding protein YceI
MRVTGTLTLHGVEGGIGLPVRVVVSGDTLRASGTFSLRQTDHGMKPVSVGGVVKVKDEVSIEFTIVAARVDTAAPGSGR